MYLQSLSLYFPQPLPFPCFSDTLTIAFFSYLSKTFSAAWGMERTQQSMQLLTHIPILTPWGFKWVFWVVVMLLRPYWNQLDLAADFYGTRKCQGCMFWGKEHWTECFPLQHGMGEVFLISLKCEGSLILYPPKKTFISEPSSLRDDK